MLARRTVRVSSYPKQVEGQAVEIFGSVVYVRLADGPSTEVNFTAPTGKSTYTQRFYVSFDNDVTSRICWE